MKEIRDIIRFWESHGGEPLALATLVAARGSSYRRPGARMLIDARGASAGGVSAGCLEEEVIACAREVLRTGRPRLLSFDTRRRFGCQGTIEVFVERVQDGLLPELREHFVQRQCCRLETHVRGERTGTRIAPFAEESSGFAQIIEPVLRLVVLGDGADSAPLRAQAALLGWGVVLLEGPPVPSELLDDHTAVVVATHNFGRDCAALRELLPCSLRYLGVVGSRRRRDDLLFDALQADVPSRAALFAPAGLHLGAETPEEVALSIVAEIQCVFAAGTGGQLRHRPGPIHQPAPPRHACAESPA